MVMSNLNGLGPVMPVALVSFDPITRLPTLSDGNTDSTASSYITTQVFYNVVTAFYQCNVDDKVVNAKVTDLASGNVLSNVWVNTTQGVTLVAPPNPDHISLEPSSALTNTQLRSAPLQVMEPMLHSKLDQTNSYLSILTGNTDLVETLQQTTVDALTTLQGYVDSVESLLTSLGSNSDQVEGLLNTLGVQTDQVEALLTSVLEKIIAAPATEAKQDTVITALAQMAKLTDTQPVSGPVTNAEMRSAPIVIIDKSSWASETVVGMTRDATKDVTTNYGDGTAETLYFTTAGDYAGKSERV